MFNESYVQFIGLNPSTADERNDDPTVRRCINFAKRWGYGAMCMTNIFAYRATDPGIMKAQMNPISEPPPVEGWPVIPGGVIIRNQNDYYLWTIAQGAGVIIAAWGFHGDHLSRAEQVQALIPNLHCLGTTAGGHPRHPLYIRGDIQPRPFTPNY